MSFELKWANAGPGLTCRNGSHPIDEGADVILVLNVPDEIRHDVWSKAFCGTDHLQSYVLQRELDWERSSREPNKSEAQREACGRNRLAYQQLGREAEQIGPRVRRDSE